VYFIARFGLMQFSQFPIGKMDMLRRAHFALKNPDAVDCSPPADLARVAVLHHFYEWLRVAMLLIGASAYSSPRPGLLTERVVGTCLPLCGRRLFSGVMLGHRVADNTSQNLPGESSF
jgi:hypothetical protein